MRPSSSPAFQHVNFDSEENIDVNFFKIQEDFTYQNYINIDDRYGLEICVPCRRLSYLGCFPK